MILISACLLGINCKYNGKNNFNKKAFDLLKNGKAIPVCPEQLGGMKTPRNPVEIKNNRVIDAKGNDYTDIFIRGANEVLSLAIKLDIRTAVLQSRSPSCGIGKIYSGNFDKKLVPGNGILADLLIKNNIKVIDINDL